MFSRSLLVRVIVLATVYISGSDGYENTILSIQPMEAIENTSVVLTCFYSGAFAGQGFSWFLNTTGSAPKKFATAVANIGCNIPPGFLENSNVYSYNCTSGTKHILTIRKISLQMHGETWRCGLNDYTLTVLSNIVGVLVSVPVSHASLIPYTDTDSIAENSTFKWECTTSQCRPKPKFRWYITNDTQPDENATIISESNPTESSYDVTRSYTEQLIISVNRTWNGRLLFCGANRVDGYFVLSAKLLLNITYPPDGPPRIANYGNGSEINVIKDGIVNLKCLITGGNPLPRLEWNKNNDTMETVSEIEVSRDLRYQAIEKMNEELICRATQFSLTYTTYVSVNVLYPPEIPKITILTLPGSYMEVSKTLEVIEGRQYSLNCSADSNPPVSFYQWNNLIPTNSSVFNFTITDRHDTENITCKVSNDMLPTVSRTVVTGTNKTYLEVNVLYPPTINILRDATIIEGDNLNNLCKFTPGNPSDTNITWSYNDSTWDVDPQQPYIVTRNQSGLYQCSVQNLMVSSDGASKFGNASAELDLSVQYKAKVLRFLANEQNDKVNITINENDVVNLTCEIEGLPLPEGQLLHQSFLNQQVEELPRYLTSQASASVHLTSSFPAQCMDTGIHTCAGINTLYNGSQATSNKSIALLVMCKPRKSPFHTILDTVPSATSVDVTFSFTALAYPVPSASGFLWAKKEDTTDTWATIATNGRKTIISTWELQSNLTIKNVQQFDYGVYRLLIDNGVGQFSHTFNLTSAVNTNDGTTGPSFSSILIAAGAAAGGFAILVAVIIIVVVYKRRLNKRKKHVSSQHIDFDSSKASDGYMELVLCEQQSAISDEHEQPPVLPCGHPIKKNVSGLDNYDENIETDSVYGNAYEVIKRIERVGVTELFAYLTGKTAEFFAADFEKLPHGLTKPYEFSQRPENIALNIYHGIYPCTNVICRKPEIFNRDGKTGFVCLISAVPDLDQNDHSRVKIPSIPEYFINACYIDGYKRKKVYIASSGPQAQTSNRFVMFWQMVWSEKSDVIVMLTKLTEPSGEKCEQYWPKDGTSDVFGEITVTSTGEEVFADYISRTFSILKTANVRTTGVEVFAKYVSRTLSILKGGKKRILTHFQFVTWPDKSVPDDAACLLEFQRRVKANHTSGPMIVHCSDGIGQTGTFIAITILIEEGQAKGSVNVLECVKKMREQRMNMVQTRDQYYYIFKALVNGLVFDNEAIPSEKFHNYVESSKHKRFSDMFQNFNQSVETTQSNSRIANNSLTEKNRIGSDIPGDAHRVRLVLNREMQTSDYINAVYLNSFTVADRFIVAQSPLLNGVEDFLSLIYQEKCICVVSMDGNLARQEAVGSCLPPDDSSFTLGNFKVHCCRLDTNENYIVRKIKIEIGQHKDEETVVTVYHFQFLTWLDENKAPNDPRQFVELTEDVARYARQFGSEESHVLVHCLNAYERSCLFCAVVALTEKMKHEKEVCVPNTLRQIRTRRKLAIPTLEQFKFCYQAVDAYISISKERANVAKQSYLNITIKV